MNSTIQIRINKKIKELARKKFEKAGLDLSSGIKGYLTEMVNSKESPIIFRTENGFTPAQERKMLKEVAYALKHGKSYKTAEELHKAILNS